MSLKHLRDLHWQPGRGTGRLRAAAMAVALLLALAAVLQWKQSIDTERAQQERRLLQVERLAADATPRVVRPTPRMSPAAVRQVNSQIGLLNREWPSLLRQMVPTGDVELLTLDVNPATGAVRMTGAARDAALANAYAERLQRGAAQLGNVRLMLLERKAGQVEFEVTAQWNE
jgi:hypothetical protein